MVQLKLLAAGPQAPLDIEPYHEWRVSTDDPHATFYRLADGHLLRFAGRADFFLTNNSELVSCRPSESANEESVHFLFTNQVVPLLHHRAGKVVLHGSAVTASGFAIGFAGPSGRGKSTLAAAFARVGYPFLTDDGLLIEREGDTFVAMPSFPQLRLWTDSNEAILGVQDARALPDGDEKRRVAATDEMPFGTQPAGLRAIYLLGPGEVESLVIEPLGLAAAFNALLQHSFILDIDNHARMRLQWEQVAVLAEKIPCFTLDYPRRYEQFPGVLEAILDHARHGVVAA